MLAIGAALLAYLTYPGKGTTTGETWQSRRGQIETALTGQHIKSVSVSLEILPDTAKLRATSAVTVASGDAPKEHFNFLLNTGLRVSGCTVNDVTVKVARRGVLVSVPLAQGMDTSTSYTVRVVYEGTPEPVYDSSPVLTGDLWFLPGASLWYPCDLQSFHDLEYTVSLLSGWEAVTNRQSPPVEEPPGTWRWRESRPVLVASLAAGRLVRRGQVFGDSLCTVYATPELENQVESVLQEAGKAYQALSGLYGPDGFESSVIVLHGGPADVPAGCNAVFLHASAKATTPRQRFVQAAHSMAGNWWGGTVAGRRWSEANDGSAWLVEGMGEYSVWAALQRTYGKQALVGYLTEHRTAKNIPVPLKSIGLLEASRYSDVLRGFGAYIPHMIVQAVGEEPFFGACERFLAIHASSTASYSSFRQEVEIAADLDLDEWFHTWFERQGAMDYTLAAVHPSAGSVEVQIGNSGQIPCQTPISIMLDTGDQRMIEQVSPGQTGGTFVFPVSGTVQRVILDTGFDVPDTNRADNVWPRQAWPLGVAASESGDIAWWAAREWNQPGIVDISVLRPGEEILHKSRLSVPLQGFPAWSPPESQLAWSTGATRAERVHVWPLPQEPFTIAHRSIGELAGWWDRQTLLCQTAGGQWMRLGVLGATALSGSDAPHPVVAVSNPEAGLIGYIAPEEPGLHIADIERDAPPYVFLPEQHFKGTPLWTGGRLLACSAAGVVYSIMPEPPAESTVMDLGYAVEDAAFSPAGSYLAWIDPGGNLRFSALELPESKYVQFGQPVDLVDWCWGSDGLLIALTATTGRELPTRFHAQYVLWRIPVESGVAGRIAVDPAQLN